MRIKKEYTVPKIGIDNAIYSVYKILEKLSNKYYNTYESTFANIFPAYEIYFRLRVKK